MEKENVVNVPKKAEEEKAEVKPVMVQGDLLKAIDALK